MAYTKTAKFLHWAIALLLLMMLGFGQRFELIAGDPDEMAFSLTGHSSLGFMVIGLVLLRIFWRIGHPPPALPDTVTGLQKLAANASHLLLYALMIYLPVTGLMAAAVHEFPVTPFGAFDVRELLSFLGGADFDARRALHEWGTWGLMALLLIHIGAAVFHGVVQKDGVFGRMWPNFLKFGKGKAA